MTFARCRKYHVKGADAGVMLNRMVTRDVSKLPLNRVAYVVWCTDEGRMVDDGTIFHLAENEYMLTCGSSCNEWLRMSSLGFENVEIVDSRTRLRHLSLQGPTSCAVLKKMGLVGIETSKAVRHSTLPVRRRYRDGVPHRVYGRPRV